VKQNSRTENFQTEHCRKENSGTTKIQESQFVMEFEKFFWRKFQDFILNRAENSRTFDSS